MALTMLQVSLSAWFGAVADETNWRGLLDGYVGARAGKGGGGKVVLLGPETLNCRRVTFSFLFHPVYLNATGDGSSYDLFVCVQILRNCQVGGGEGGGV